MKLLILLIFLSCQADEVTFIAPIPEVETTEDERVVYYWRFMYTKKDSIKWATKVTVSETFTPDPEWGVINMEVTLKKKNVRTGEDLSDLGVYYFTGSGNERFFTDTYPKKYNLSN